MENSRDGDGKVERMMCNEECPPVGEPMMCYQHHEQSVGSKGKQQLSQKLMSEHNNFSSVQH